MKLRPCIDIHNGKVKQIVGSTLKDDGEPEENFVSANDASYYAGLYRERSLTGGHVIVLNGRGSEYYDESKNAALSALSVFRNGMQYGGGINDENAAEFLNAGASHVIVTSFVFRDGKLNVSNLDKLQREIGKEKVVLDLSCRKKPNGSYHVATDRWQKFTDFEVTEENLISLSNECSEFLIHAVDVEGSASGIDKELVRMLSSVRTIPVTYAGGVKELADVDLIRSEGRGHVDFTIGSALDIFGGSIGLDNLISYVG